MCCVFSRHQDLLRWSTRTHCGGSWPPSPGPLIVSRPAIQEYAKVQEIHWNLINGSLRFDIQWIHPRWGPGSYDNGTCWSGLSACISAACACVASHVEGLHTLAIQCSTKHALLTCIAHILFIGTCRYLDTQAITCPR